MIFCNSFIIVWQVQMQVVPIKDMQNMLLTWPIDDLLPLYRVKVLLTQIENIITYHILIVWFWCRQYADLIQLKSSKWGPTKYSSGVYLNSF